jgi:hypothetical protein
VSISVFGHIRFYNRGSDPFQSTSAAEQRHFLSPTIFFKLSTGERHS